MNKQYVSVSRLGGSLYSKEIDLNTGERHHYRFKEFPFRYFVHSKDGEGVFHDVKGRPLKEMSVDSVDNFSENVKTMKAHGYTLFGTSGLQYQYIYEKFDSTKFVNNHLRIGFFDIETGKHPERGYAPPKDPFNEITSISLASRNKVYYWAMKDLPSDFPEKHGFEFFWFDNEHDMALSFLNFVRANDFDVLSGWNIEAYDIPYILNRCDVLGVDKKLISPFKKVLKREFTDSFGNDAVSYTIVGIAVLDYLALYKKFTYVMRENYTLNHIAYVELGEQKVDYSEHGNLERLYEQDFIKFTEYNIKDSTLVKRLEDKLKLIELCITLSYKAGVNFEDALGTVKIWTYYLYKEMMNKRLVPPMHSEGREEKTIVGAFVKEPLKGMHDWVVSFDLASLYPHNQMGCNISTDKLLDDEELPADVIELKSSIWRKYLKIENIIDALANKEIDLSILKKYNIGMTPNIQFYKNDEQGFIPSILREIYNERKQVKGEMIKRKQELENLKNKYRHWEHDSLSF